MSIVEIPEEMIEKYKEAKDLIEKSERIKIYTHIDCDGMCSGAILSTILDRLGKKHEIDFVNLDVLEDFKLEHDLTIFSDLGSGQPVNKNAKENNNILILDHHPPLRDINYNKTVPYEYIEINPNYHGINGSEEVCGGGLCYFLAKLYNFTDLSWIGVLSAVGDMQNTKHGKLVGVNTIILNDAIEEGYVKVNGDVNLYGRETRPIQTALSYFGDVQLPITNNRNESISLLKSLDIPLTTEDKNYRTLSDLTQEEKGKLVKKLNEMILNAIPNRYIPYVPKLITCDTYDFLKEEEHTFLHDASEFATSMNACGRNKEYLIALDILKGNRDVAFDQLIEVTKQHKYNIRKSVERAIELGISQLENLQYLDAEGIKSISIIGTVIGMILSYGDWRKPIIGFADIEGNNKMLKVSLRCSRLLAYDGIHFGEIIREVAQSVGGNGGGHNVACGAYIPINKKEEFLNTFNEKLEGKLILEDV